MDHLRSLLFVPGHRSDWIRKAPKYGADALILDLEDSVPADQKRAARAVTGELVQELGAGSGKIFVRINALETGEASLDVEAVVRAGLSGVLVPKVERAADVRKVDAWLEHFERKVGLPAGAVKILPWPETALGIKDANSLATACERVSCVVNVAGGRAGDVAAAIGYRRTAEAQEIVYLRSHVLLANRAAGVRYPVSAGILDIGDLDAVRRELVQLRDIGYRGAALIHPSAVPIANEIFAPTAEEIAWHRGVLEAMADAVAKGQAAIAFDGMMVDYAHVRNALEVLRQAKAFGITVGPYPEIVVP